MYKKVLLASVVLLATATPGAAFAFWDYDSEDEENEIIVGNPAKGHFEAHIWGGWAGFDPQDADLKFHGVEDKLRNSDNDWDSWTAQIGVGYVQPLFCAEECSNELQWLTAIQPQINLYYVDGNVNGDLDYNGSHHYKSESTLKIQSTRLMLDGELTLAQWRNISVYGLAGLGIAWNRVGLNAHGLHGFDPDTQDEWEIEGFSDCKQTSTSFAYEFGGGITADVTDRLGVSLQYLFTGMDAVELSSHHHDGTDFHLNTQALMLGLRWAI